MKIALLGSAPSSIGRAPFKDSNYEAWLGSKREELNRLHGDVPGDFQIWGCSPGCFGIAPRSDRWFEVHRWEPGQSWFSPEYVQFLRDYKGPVYVGGKVPEIPNAVVYPIDRMEEKFASYFMNSSLSLMLALAIDTIEQVRRARESHMEAKLEKARLDAGVPTDANPNQCLRVHHQLPPHVDQAELEKADEDDVIGLWGVDMAAAEEYAYQKPGCQFFILEAMRRGIGVYLPPESDLMRPMPVYGISEWDHNYIKLTSRARELNAKAAGMQKQRQEASEQLAGIQGEMHALNHFVNTWTSPYGMLPGMVIRQTPGTGLGSGITHFDSRPVQRMTVEDPKPVLDAMSVHPDAQAAREVATVLLEQAVKDGVNDGPLPAARRIAALADVARTHSNLLQPYAHAGESSADTLRRVIEAAVKGRRKGGSMGKSQKPVKPMKPTKRRR